MRRCKFIWQTSAFLFFCVQTFVTVFHCLRVSACPDKFMTNGVHTIFSLLQQKLQLIFLRCFDISRLVKHFGGPVKKLKRQLTCVSIGWNNPPGLRAFPDLVAARRRTFRRVRRTSVLFGDIRVLEQLVVVHLRIGQQFQAAVRGPLHHRWGRSARAHHDLADQEITKTASWLGWKKKRGWKRFIFNPI